MLFIMCWSSLFAAELTDAALTHQALRILDEATNGENDVMTDIYGAYLSVHGFNTETITTRHKLHKIVVKATLVENHYACALIKWTSSGSYSVSDATRFESLNPALLKCGFPEDKTNSSAPKQPSLKSSYSADPTDDKDIDEHEPVVVRASGKKSAKKGRLSRKE